MENFCSYFGQWQLLLKLLDLGGKRNKKAWFWDNLSILKVFVASCNVEADFSVKWNKFFWIVIKTFEVTTHIC